MIIGGVVAGQGEISLVLLIGLVWICCVLGDTTSFFIGRRLGRDFLLAPRAQGPIDEKRLEQVEAYFERHGGKTILIGRFIGLVRALAPFVAGSSGLPTGASSRSASSAAGCGRRSSASSATSSGRSFDQVAAIAGKATLVFGDARRGDRRRSCMLFRRLRDEERARALMAWLERQGERPLLRPAWRRSCAPRVAGRRPAACGSSSHRLTPGDLGLELTTALAVSGGRASTCSPSTRSIFVGRPRR